MGLTSYQWENDQWHLVSGIPLSDRGFRHGMSAFETIAIRGGRFIFLGEHLAKLRHTCAQLGLREPPDSISLSLPTTGTARLYITAGDGPFRAPFNAGRIFLMLEATPLRPPPSSLSIASTPHNTVWPSLKTGNYWPNIAAYRESPSDEIVLLNAANHVISASLANLFAVIDGLLLTPRVASGARAGVMRDWVIQREEVIIGDFHPEQLREASEIFLTGSGYGIAPIATMENQPLASQAIAQKLLTDYLTWLETQ